MFTINRRNAIAGACGLIGVSAIARAAAPFGSRDGAELVPLWPDTPPGGGGPRGTVSIDGRGAISSIAMPTLEIYCPRQPNGTAVLIAPGGGYKRLEMESEARPAARWLVAHGVTAFVLGYRLPGEGWTDGPLAPLQDAQRALRVIADAGARHGFSPDRTSALGFSAGGHLLGLASTRSAFASYRHVDRLDETVARPSRAALIYPVVTLMPPYDHTSTRVQLIGRHPTIAQSAEWSVETHVRSHCPPLFLVQALDDPISNIENTAILDRAALRVGIPVERHVLPSGGHGFGMGRPGSPTAEWPHWYAQWLGLERVSKSPPKHGSTAPWRDDRLIHSGAQ